MIPSLREADLLEITPCEAEELHRGDVIIFEAPKNKELVVHRIIEVRSDGFLTRGDNTSRPDAYVLSPADIYGKVQTVWRAWKRKPVIGGFPGLVLAGVTRHVRRQGMKCLPLLRKVYHACSRPGIFACFVPSGLKARVVAFKRHDRFFVRLLFGSRAIGHYNFSINRWTIQRPYRLFIDERELPIPQFPERL